MMPAAQRAQVVHWLSAYSATPVVAVRLWMELFRHLDQETGEITESREGLAEALGIRPEAVSRVMVELEGIGAVARRRERVPGMRGPGVVRYVIRDGLDADPAMEVARERA